MIETKLIIIATQNFPDGNYDIIFSQLKSKLNPSTNQNVSNH